MQSLTATIASKVATITIRNLDDQLKTRLRLRAAEHGRSMEEEARRILGEALNEPAYDGIGTRIRERFAALGGVELELPERSEAARAADFRNKSAD